MVIIEIAEYAPEFGDLKVKVISNKWYFSRYIKEDEISKKIYFSKSEDKSTYFINDIDICYESYNEKFDLICVIPRSEINKYSVTLTKLARHLADKNKLNYENIILRSKRPDKKMSECVSAQERLDLHKGTLTLSRNLNENEKSILLLDDTKAGGDTKLLCAKLLKDAGAVEVKVICLGINTIDKNNSN